MNSSKLNFLKGVIHRAYITSFEEFGKADAFTKFDC
jgi:hypothetical protein